MHIKYVEGYAFVCAHYWFCVNFVFLSILKLYEIPSMDSSSKKVYLVLIEAKLTSSDQLSKVVLCSKT